MYIFFALAVKVMQKIAIRIEKMCWSFIRMALLEAYVDKIILLDIDMVNSI